MMKDNWRTQVLVYAVLTGYAFISLFPVVFIFMNSFKDRRDLFRTPYQPPVWFSLDHGLTLINKTSLAGYETVLSQGEILRYFSNSFLVSVLSLLLIVVLGLMLAYALTEYDFRGNLTLYVFFVLGIMIPQQIGTATIIDLVQALGLYDTVWALILIYTARGLPIRIRSERVHADRAHRIKRGGASRRRQRILDPCSHRRSPHQACNRHSLGFSTHSRVERFVVSTHGCPGRGCANRYARDDHIRWSISK
jgi:ABC-type spermidine/putrescine transport system permease subunit II